jgi:hypothetical protein
MIVPESLTEFWALICVKENTISNNTAAFFIIINLKIHWGFYGLKTIKLFVNISLKVQKKRVSTPLNKFNNDSNLLFENTPVY